MTPSRNPQTEATFTRRSDGTYDIRVEGDPCQFIIPPWISALIEAEATQRAVERVREECNRQFAHLGGNGTWLNRILDEVAGITAHAARSTASEVGDSAGEEEGQP